jgi:hypothetical protein
VLVRLRQAIRFCGVVIGSLSQSIANHRTTAHSWFHATDNSQVTTIETTLETSVTHGFGEEKPEFISGSCRA